MRRILALLVVIVIVILAIWWFFFGASRYDLLMAATFGRGSDGSYARYDDDDVTLWRSRGYFDLESDAALDGYGDCRVGLTATVYNLSEVYLFDADTGNPLLVGADGVVVLPRPIRRFPEILDQGGDGPVFDARISQFPEGSAEEPEREVPIFDLSGVIGEIGRDDVEGLPDDLGARIVEGLADRTLLPNPIDAGEDREQFNERVGQLIGVVRAAGIRPQVGLNMALVPSQWHGSGSDDPTAVPADAESGHLVEAAAGLRAANPANRQVWIADFGLPGGMDPSSTPVNLIDDPNGSPQVRPADDGDVTPQFGHGLMVGSVAAQVAPGTDIRLIDVSEIDATGRDSISVDSIDAAMLRTDRLLTEPGVLNMSFGAYDCVLDDIAGYRGGVVAALEAVLEPYVAKRDLLVVAAAGNDGAISPFYPAAFDGVIGVGAWDTTVLNRDECLSDGVEAWSPASDAADPSCRPIPGVPAEFSNIGVNADTDYPGVDVVVHYPLFADPIDYRYLDFEGESDALDTGRVRISGTSFAAPLFSVCHDELGNQLC
ncbi:MAG: S8/S53 family peptidase [Acidimicrobiia bacterium]|nr:S8/S53 family peptidase [Acidimicrobiia bacterium]